MMMLKGAYLAKRYDVKKVNFPLEDGIDFVEARDLKKRVKYLQSCKDKVWKRWTNEYLKSLRERHNMKHQSKEMKLRVGNVVVIKGDERNRAHWKTGIVDKLISRRDCVVEAVRLCAEISLLERAVQHLYPLELSFDMKQSTVLNAEIKEFRPQRNAAAIANICMQDQLTQESEKPPVE